MFTVYCLLFTVTLYFLLFNLGWPQGGAVHRVPRTAILLRSYCVPWVNESSTDTRDLNRLYGVLQSQLYCNRPDLCPICVRVVFVKGSPDEPVVTHSAFLVIADVPLLCVSQLFHLATNVCGVPDASYHGQLRHALCHHALKVCTALPQDLLFRTPNYADESYSHRIKLTQLIVDAQMLASPKPPTTHLIGFWLRPVNVSLRPWASVAETGSMLHVGISFLFKSCGVVWSRLRHMHISVQPLLLRAFSVSLHSSYDDRVAACEPRRLFVVVGSLYFGIYVCCFSACKAFEDARITQPCFRELLQCTAYCVLRYRSTRTAAALVNVYFYCLQFNVYCLLFTVYCLLFTV